MVSFFLPFMHYYQDTLQLRLETMIRLISSNTEGPNIKRILGLGKNHVKYARKIYYTNLIFPNFV